MIDTLKYAKNLRETGMSEAQANGQAEALAQALETTSVTKTDIIELKLELTEKINNAENKINSSMDRIFIRLSGLITIFGIVLGILTFFKK